jgi:hypothetical protein
MVNEPLDVRPRLEQQIIEDSTSKDRISNWPDLGAANIAANAAAFIVISRADGNSICAGDIVIRDGDIERTVT